MTNKATCTVTVERANVVQPSGITVAPTSLSLKVGDTGQITATISNENDLDAEHKKITWCSENENIATVNDDGLVSAVSMGETTITAKTINGKAATCVVTVTAQTTAPVTVSEDAWNLLKRTDITYLTTTSQELAENHEIDGEKKALTLMLLKNGTKTGTTKGTPAYRYDSDAGLCIKKDALKIENIKGLVEVVIEWYFNGSSNRDLEVTIGNGETKKKTVSSDDKGKTFVYTDTFDGGDGTTLYIGASNELYIKSITITPQSGGGTVTPNPAPDPTPDPDPTDKTISLTDKVLGYASKGTGYKTSGGTPVTSRAGLVSAISKGGVIIIDGMIDMSEGKLPATGGKSTDSTSKLDALVHDTYSKYANYAAWVEAYSKACTLTTDDDKSGSGNSALQAEVAALNKAYGDFIKLTLKSGTTLIGKGPNCGIRGGSIQISNASNIQIRNLTIQDAFDPFPHHEVKDNGTTDGYNAQWDGINIQNTCENIWIDHVTFEDTMTLGYVYTQGVQDDDHHEKWQTYDGLCDMKDDSTNITISNCIFRNHDKTMLIGSSDSNGDNTKRFVTLQGNYFYNCGQRLPMVRNTTIHILNNYYDADSNPRYKQQYAVGCRKNSIIYAEANYFGSGVYYSFKDNDGKLYDSGNTDKASKGMTTKSSGSTLFSTAVKDAYTYTPVSAEQAKANAIASAGAGYTLEQ
ncbi:MAG: Ig-like domain-containing protein [Treponemataceae bacterium]|nr:Ig-like domain-containing protein [Treponemataceae bacterium]